VTTEDEIGFIFVILKDFSKSENNPNSQEQRNNLEELEKSRLEINQSKEELEKKAQD